MPSLGSTRVQLALGSLCGCGSTGLGACGWSGPGRGQASRACAGLARVAQTSSCTGYTWHGLAGVARFGRLRGWAGASK